jgi:hypothetical protein
LLREECPSGQGKIPLDARAPPAFWPARWCGAALFAFFNFFSLLSFARSIACGVNRGGKAGNGMSSQITGRLTPQFNRGVACGRTRRSSTPGHWQRLLGAWRQGSHHPAQANDLCRAAMGVAGSLFQTAGINALPSADQSAIREKVETFQRREDFLEDRPLAPDIKHGSEDASDPKQTVRVLTIMLASEY